MNSASRHERRPVKGATPAQTLALKRTRLTIEKWFAVLDRKEERKLQQTVIYNVLERTRGLKVLGNWNKRFLPERYRAKKHRDVN